MSISGQISCKFRQSKTFAGHDVRICISAIQKYARRGELDKGLYFLTQLNTFSKVETGEWASHVASLDKVDEKSVITRAKCIRTNMVNRLLVIMVEDVGIANWRIPKFAKRWHIEWSKHRNTSEGNRLLVEFYTILCKSKKCRILSDLKTRYCLPPYYIDDVHTRNEMYIKLLTKLDLADCRKSWCNESFSKCLDEKSIDCFDHVPDLFDTKNVTTLVKKLTNRQDDVIDALLYFYRHLIKNKEAPLFIYQSLLNIIWIDKLEKQTIDRCHEFLDYSMLEDNIGDTIEVDEYVKDKHAGFNTTCTQFALEGAHVPDEYEDKELVDTTLRKIYIEFKKMKDTMSHAAKRKHKDDNLSHGCKKIRRDVGNLSYSTRQLLQHYPLETITYEDESDITKLPHGQLLTGKYKKVVYIGEKYTWKGPYYISDCSLYNNLWFIQKITEAEKLLGLDTCILPLTVEQIDDRYYLRTERVGLVHCNSGKISTYFVGDASICVGKIVNRTSKLESNVPIIERKSGVYRVSDVDQSKLPDHVRIKILQHLYFRWFFGIGDSGTHNMLINGQDVYGIDFDEKLTNRGPDRLESYFKRFTAGDDKNYSRFFENIVKLN